MTSEQHIDDVANKITSSRLQINYTQRLSRHERHWLHQNTKENRICSQIDRELNPVSRLETNWYKDSIFERWRWE